MTFTINIENGISLYTGDELISYANSGCLYAGNVDLSELVEKILDTNNLSYYSHDQIESIKSQAYDDGFEHGKLYCDCYED